MNIGDVMDELAARIDTIPGLRAFGYPPDAINPPAAVVSYPAIEYDSTYARGMDRLTVPLVLLVGKVSARASRDLLTAYLDGSGPRSIKAVVEPGPHTAFHSVRVTEAEEPEPVSVAGVEHLACILSLDVVGGN